MMATLARFSIRYGEGEKQRLILGLEFQTKLLKSDTIYAIVDIMGTLQVVEVGPSAAETDFPDGKHCGWLPCDMIESSDGAYVKTKEEATHEARKEVGGE